MLKYLKKHEHFEEIESYASRFNTDIRPLYNMERRCTKGPIHTSAGVWRLPLEKEWMEACAGLNAEIGAPENPGSVEKGVSYHSLRTIDTSTAGMMGTRSYSTTGYLLPNAGRPNLHVLTETLITNLIVESNGTVTGVAFVHAGMPFKVDVKKEVIVSAGTVKSPQILELSGIGNPEVLKKACVRCTIENINVGENLRDHPVTGTGFELVAWRDLLRHAAGPCSSAMSL
jgi:choline dehydrogenase-like flavoprotein